MNPQNLIRKNFNNMLKITLQKGQHIFITSDTHFGHKNICRGVTEWNLDRAKNSTRDFDTLDQMNQAIVDGINGVVGQDDILIHIGDWSFGGFENIRIFRDRIICRNIHLVTGNHDHHIVRDRDGIRSIFSSVHEAYTQFELRVPKANGEVDRVEMILCHFPITSWDGMNDGRFHLFGHVHLPPELCVMEGRSMDVGVDGNFIQPRNLFECFRLLQNRPVATTVLPRDHHAVEVTN